MPLGLIPFPSGKRGEGNRAICGLECDSSDVDPPYHDAQLHLSELELSYHVLMNEYLEDS